MAFKNTDINNSEWRKRKEEARNAFQNDQIKKSATFYNVTGAQRNGTDNSSKLSTKYYVGKNTQKKYLDQTKYSYTGKKDDELNFAEIIAKANREGSFSSYQPYLENAALDPSSRFYNPYFGKRTVDSVATRFLRDYFGYDGEFDERFFAETADLTQYEIRDGKTSLNIQSPGSKGTPEQWAAYYRVQVQNDMKTQDAVDEEWSDLRNQVADTYKSLEFIYGRKPTYEEVFAQVDMSKYNNLKNIDDSRNLDWGTSHAIVELNKGTWYSNESLAGLYHVLAKGGDISEDRDYFGEAVQYYMQPSVDSVTRNVLLEMGFDTSDWTDEDFSVQMDNARKAGDHEVYETLKQFRWQNSNHMDSVDTTDYLGERFGYYKDSNYFKNIEEVFAPIWNEMYTDSTRTSIKKPNSSDSMIYHAAYQAWQDMQLKEDTELVEAQAERLYKAIDDVDKNGFESEEEYAEFIRDYLFDPNSEEYKELGKYMQGKLATARDIFISEEELSEYISKSWNGTEEEVVIPQATTAPFGYDEAAEEKAVNEATKRRADAEEIAASLIAFSEAGATVSAAQIAESGISVVPSNILSSALASDTLAALWLTVFGDRQIEKTSEDATLDQRMAVDPTYKMLVEATASDGSDGVTLAGINELLTQQTVSQMSGNAPSIADGVIQAAIPDPENLIGAIGGFSEKLGSAAIELMNQAFDLKSYVNLFERNLEAGYSSEDAAEAALDAAVFGTPALDVMAEGLEDNTELSGAAQSLNGKIVASEGFNDAAGFIGGIAKQVASKVSESFEDVREFAGAALLGMSEFATEAHAAMTKDVLNEISRGDITEDDIVTGIRNSERNLATQAADVQRKEDTQSSNAITTRHYDALDDKTRANADVQYNQNISRLVSETEILDGIAAHTVKRGAGRNTNSKAADTRGEKLVTGTDFVMWLGAITSSTSDETDEQYMVKNDLRNYGKWFTFDEAYELAYAWENGIITYDGFRAVLEERVSKFSLETVNAMKNSNMLSEGAIAARTSLDALESDINHNIEVVSQGVSDDILSSAKSAQTWITGGADAESTVRAQEGLASAIDLDKIIADNEDEALRKFAIEDALTALIDGGTERKVIDRSTGSDYTLEQVDELRKAIDLYEQFGVYGYDLITSATPEQLKKFGIDLEGVGLTSSLETYMDDLTEGTWREAYQNEYLGVVGTINAALLKGYQGVGNIPAWGTRIIRDVLDSIPGIDAYQKGDGSYFDNVQRISGKIDERLANRATGFEQFSAEVVGEFVRNQLTGYMGSAMGAAARGQKAMQLASTGLKASRANDAAKVIARIPFVAGVMGRSYSENRDEGKSVFSSLMRGGFESAVELFTETVAVDEKLNAIRSFVLPGLENVSDGALGYMAKVGQDIFNEVGQEEISLMFDRMLDIADAVDTGKINDVASFFRETWRAIQAGTEGMGEEAASTAVSTMCITILGAIFDLPINSISRRRFAEYRAENRMMSAEELETLINTVIVELAEAADGAGEKTGYDPSTQVPSFNRKGVDAIKSVINGEMDVDAALAVIEEEDADVDGYQNNIENDEVEDELPVLVDTPKPQPDPNMSSGARKVAAYMNEAANGERDAVAAEVSNRIIEEGMANDPTIKSAEETVDVAKEKLAKEQEAEQVIASEVETKKQQLGKVFEAAANEGVDFNSPSVQNAVIANQQATAALQKEQEQQRQKVQDASDEVKRAEKALEQAKETTMHVLRSKAETAANKARMSFEEAKRVLRSASGKQGLVSNKEIAEQAYKNQEAPTIASDGEVDPRTTYDEDLSKEEKPKRTDKAVGADLDKITIRPDEKGRFDLNDFAGRESDAVYGVLKRDIPLKESSETVGIDNQDYSTDFDLQAKNLANVFNDIAGLSSTKKLEYFINVPKTLYSKLIGIFERIGDQDLVQSFFMHRTNTEENADQRWYDQRKRTDKTKDRAVALSSSDYNVLENRFGMVPVFESADEIIFRVDNPADEVKSNELVQAEEAVKATAQESQKYAIAIGKLNSQLNTAVGSQKVPIVQAIQEAQKLKDKADANAEAARQNLAKVQQEQGGVVTESFVAVRKDDLQAAISNVSTRNIVNDIDVSVQEDKLWEQYNAGAYTTEHLREILIENTSFSGMDEQTANLVRENIGRMSDQELLTEIVTVWREEGIKQNGTGLLDSVPHKAFKNATEMKAYTKANGGYSSAGAYQNLETEESYFVFGGLLALANQYNALLAKGDEADRNAIELSMEKLTDGDLESFFAKLVDLANKAKSPMERKKALDALGIETAAPFDEGKTYAAVDTVPFGTLLVNAKCRNYGLTDANGNFIIHRAANQIKKAFEQLKHRDDTGNYTVRVVENVDGKRVVRQVGEFYADLEGRYLPTYTYAMKNASEIFLQHRNTSGSGKEYNDLDFSIKIKDSRSDNALKAALDEADAALLGLFDSTVQPSAEDFKTYAITYLQAKRDSIERELNRKVREYRLHGATAGKDAVVQLGEEVSALQSELAQINDALRNIKALDKYMDTYKFSGTGTNRDALIPAVEDTLSKVDADSPEAQAAVALADAASEAQEATEGQKTASTKVKRKVAYEVSKRLRDKRQVEKTASTSENETNDGASEEMEPEKLAVVDGTDMAEDDMAESYGMEEADAMLLQAMEEYEIDSEDEAAIDEAYPNRKVKEDAEQFGSSEQFADPKPVDENTSVGGMGHDAESIEYGRRVIRQQNAFIKNLQNQIDALVPQIKTEWENGANYWSALAKEKKQLLQELSEAGDDAAKKAALRDSINRIYVAQQKSNEARESFERWTILKSKKQALEARRNTGKYNLKINSQMVNGTEVAKQLAENDVQYTPHAPIAGTKGNKNGVQIAKEILKEAYSGKLMKYGKKTALTVKHVADLLKSKFEPSFYETVKEDAKIITSTRKSTEQEHADDIYRMACIDAALQHGDAEKAKDDLIAAYQDSIERTDFTKEGFKDYQNARRDAREQALEKAKKIADEYRENKSKRELQEEKVNLSYKIEEDAVTIANMRSTEKAYYRLGDGDVEAALGGEYGGQIPVPLMNIFTGMILNASEGKSGSKFVTREMDSTERIVDSYLGDYAPFINAVFINPALRASDAQRAESSKILKSLSKVLPNKNIKVTTTKNGKATTEKMSLNEIVGHIIDERTNDEFAAIPDADYVQERLRLYGITDAETRKQISDAVDYGRQLNDALYTRANDELVNNGHFGQTYNYRKWYMHHYNNENDNAILALFGIHTNDDEISQVFIDETGNRRPSHEFNAAALERHGDATGYDFTESVRRSLSGVLNTIYQTGNIDRLKQLEQAINGTPKLDEEGNYVYENNKVVLDSRPMFEVDADGNAVDKNYLTGIGNTIGQFAQRAANKRTGNMDRAIMKSPAGRKALGWVRLAASIRSANAVAFNPMSAITNFAPVKFLVGICSVEDMASAMASTVAQMSGTANEQDFIAANSNFVKGRSEHSAEERSIQGKVLDDGYAMSAAVDAFTTNFMARALFNHEMRTNGGDAEVALVQTEDMLRRMLTDKSRVGRSQFYENASIGGVFGQFQQESVNELMYMMKDMKYYGGSKIPKALAMMLGVYIFNGLFNYLRGSETMSDPIGSMVKTFNQFDEDTTDYEKFKAVNAALAKTINPVDFFMSNETAIGSAAENIATSLDKAASGVYDSIVNAKSAEEAFADIFSKESDIWEFFTTLAYTTLPGGTTIKRANTGIKSVKQGYAESAKGNVKFLTGEPTWQKYLAAALGGVNVLPESKAYNYYFENGLGSDQSKAFKQLQEGGLDEEAAMKYVKSPKEATDKEQYDVDKALENTEFKSEVDDLGDEAMNADYKRLYEMHMKAYTRGDYGKVGSTKARDALEKALQDAKTKVKEKHSTKNKSNEEVE